MKIKLIAIVLAAVLAVGGAGTAVAVSIANSPENVAISAIADFFEDFTEREEINPIYKMLTGGSLEASISELKENKIDLLDGGSASGKIYFSSDAYMLENLKVDIDGVKISGDVYLSEDMLYVNEDEIIGGAYGVKYSKIAKQFEESIFAYGSGSDYEITDKDEYEEILKAFESVDNNEELRSDAEKIVTKYIKKLWKIVCEHAEFKSENDDVRFVDEKAKARVITVKVTPEAMCDIVKDVCEMLKDDDSVVDFLAEYESSFSAIADSYVTDGKTLSEEYLELIDEFEADLDDISETIMDEAQDFELEIVTPKMSSRLLKLTAKYDSEELISVDLSTKGIKDAEKISVSIGGTTVRYIIKTNDKKAYKAELTANGETVAEIDVDKKDESFEVSIADTAELSGTFEAKSSKTTVTFKKLKITTESFYEGAVSTTYKTDLTITVDEKDSIPKAPRKYNDLSDITDDDVDRWIKEFEKIA